MMSSSINRRQFLKRLGILGGGIIVYFNSLDRLAWARMQRAGFLGAQIPSDFNAFLRIGVDNRVVLYTGKIEMGQGVMTSIPQLLAEELQVNYDSVDIVMGDTDLCPWDAGTFGSLSIRYFGIFLREAASEARGVLLELAADHLGTPIGRLATRSGIIYDPSKPDRRVSYGDLTQGRIIEKHLKGELTLKPSSEYEIMGQSLPRRDAVEKVTGAALFSGDIRLEGMLYAKILRPPAHGAKLIKADTEPAKSIDGLQIVQDGDFVAVLHKNPEVAEQGLAQIKAQFDSPATGISDKTIFDHLLKSTPEPEIASKGGNLKTGEKLASTIIEETYFNSYVAHAPMEPHTAAAEFDGKKLTVWASTQTPFRVKEFIAEQLSLPPDRVRIITPYVGGGFGGKSASRQALEAARLAKKIGKPVQVAWSRAEEFFYDTFRPAAIVKIKSGLDRSGGIVFWDYNVYYAGMRGSEQFYEVPHHKEVVHGLWRGRAESNHPFGIGPWRAPANNTNTYARELHLNLMAARAGVDPLQFRLNHLKDKRMINVLQAAAKSFGWQSLKPPSGRGQGIACGIDAGTYVAFMAEVEVDTDSGSVAVKRVVCAQDMGVVVNPEGATTQMEGCITMGLGYALTEEIHFADGEIFDLNFDTYAIPRFSWLPKIETVILQNPDLGPQGGGEPAIIGMGGVIATAIHDAVGAAVFQLPMTPERVKAAIKAA
ncbi:MAG: molybdopterin cofactor-binding domain-containing protein [Desulfobacteraceae bacterium]|jgi:isoquinoline 1-oxidoreductase|nr:molybdopterin cofactor-binding domain-containing protein [Desulfobacteraceae bacterium]